MPKNGGPVSERFWRYVSKPVLEGCWEWTGAKDQSGYGRLASRTPDGRRTTVMAHRVSWEIHHGPIPPGLNPCHRCDNRGCSNPDHLFLGTQKDNVHDAIAKGRIRFAREDGRFMRLSS
jgi:hypothetical protein